MSARISGRTRLAGIIGWPVEQSLSPAMHNAAYQALGLDWAYIPLPVPDESALVTVVEALRSLPFVGFNVTMPYKRMMLQLCDEVATLARMAGAVNTVHCVDGRLIGYNTDGRGIVDSITAETGFDPAERSVAIIGAGGAAAAALVSLVLGKAARVVVLNRNVEKAEELIERMQPFARKTVLEAAPLGADTQEIVREADLVVNATPLGMTTGDKSPVLSEWLRPGQVVADMVYSASPTPLVEAARLAGATALDGLGMLVEQGAVALEIWWADEDCGCAPRDVMRRAAEDALFALASEEDGRE